jgi:hypothetical protein
MRAVEFALPSLPVEKWAEFELLYVVPQAEVELMQRCADAGQRGYLTFDDFLRLARWKSPRPTKRYKQNSEPAVRDVTTAAFASENDVEKVLELTRLVGINVRAATAILHLCFPKLYPLLDIRAMAGLEIGDDDLKDWGELHWLRAWRPYIAVCRKLSSDLGWHNLRRTDRALWAKGRSEARSRMASEWQPRGIIRA